MPSRSRRRPRTTSSPARWSRPCWSRAARPSSLGGDVTVSVHHIPGHTAGSVAYVVDGQQSVFVGDAVQIHGAANGFPGYEDPAAYRSSLQYLRDDVRPQHLYLGHPYRGADGVPYGVELDRDAARNALQESLDLEARIDDAARRYLRDGLQETDSPYSPVRPRRRGTRLRGRPHASSRPRSSRRSTATARAFDQPDQKMRSFAPMDDLQTLDAGGADDRRPQGPPGPDAGRRRARRGRLSRTGDKTAPRPRGAEPLRQGAAGARPHHAAAAAPQPDVGRLHRGRRHRPRRQRGLRPRHRRPARLRATPAASTSATTTPVASRWARTPTTSSSGSPRSRGATATSA